MSFRDLHDRSCFSIGSDFAEPECFSERLWQRLLAESRTDKPNRASSPRYLCLTLLRLISTGLEWWHSRIGEP